MEKHEAFLTIDWVAGEQAWKFWVSDFVGALDGHGHQFKILTKRLAGGTFEAVGIMECENGEKIAKRKTFAQEAALEAHVSAFWGRVRRQVAPGARFEVQDYRRCKTMKEWEYQMREGTLNSIRNEKRCPEGGFDALAAR